MTIATLMIHMRAGASNTGLLHHAVDLARWFDAGVIGIAACELMQLSYGDAYISGAMIEATRAGMQTDIDAAETAFRAAFANQPGPVSWRSDLVFTSMPAYLAREARAADLVVTAPETAPETGGLFDGATRASMGELLMRLGRPMMVVPTHDRVPRFDRIMVAWKDTRETRRATLDAMPLLRRAKSVTVVEIAAAGGLDAARADVEDVAQWLGVHGVVARTMPVRADGDDSAQLMTIAAELETDVIVAGAYGHSRLREWVLGGVTRDLLLHDDRCALLSH